ncbi:MAG: glycosyltransferase family 1 protein, partial [Bacteroidota bacterium]
MKIGYDAKRLFKNTTGLGNYSRTLLHNLQAHYPEHDYHLYTPAKSHLPVARPFANPPYHVVSPNGPIHPLWRSRGVVKNLLADQIEVYHGLSHQIPAGMHSQRIKSVVTIHDLIVKRYPNTYSPIDRAFYDMKLRHCLANADAIVAISQQTKADILHYYPSTPAEKIQVIYQACDPIFYQEVLPQDVEHTRQKLGVPNHYLLFVGSFVPRKNLLNLLRAYHQANVSIPLVMVGRGKRYYRRMLRLIHKLDLTDRVFLLQSVEDTRQLQHLYAGASAFVYPSWFEGFGLPVAEALLSEVPVLTSNRSSLPEAGGPASVLVDPHNLEELTEGLLGVLDLDRESTVAVGKEYARQHFSPQVTTQQMMGK